MKLEKTGSKYNITEVSQAELEMLFHPHNVVSFQNALPMHLKGVSEVIYHALVENAYDGKVSHEKHKEVAKAMTFVK